MQGSREEARFEFTRSLELIIKAGSPWSWMYLLGVNPAAHLPGTQVDAPSPLQALITCLASFVAFDQTQIPKINPVQKSHSSPGGTPGLGHQAPFICSPFKLMEWLGRVHNCLSPSTASVNPCLHQNHTPKTFPINVWGHLTLFHLQKQKPLTSKCYTIHQ